MRSKSMKKYATPEELDALFESGVDMSDYWDVENATRPNLAQRNLLLSLPVRTVDKIEQEAKRLGIPREVMVTAWIDAHLPA